MVTHYLNKTLTAIFGSRNDRLIKTYRKRLVQINALEPHFRTLTDQAMREKADEIRERLAKGESDLALLPEAFGLMREAMDRHIGLRNALNPESGFDPAILDAQGQELYSAARSLCIGEHDWHFVEMPVALYNAIRAAVPSDRPPYRARPFDVQLIGGMVLYEGRIAEMATGEGKTFVAPLACLLMGLSGKHCHVVTVNDYLVRRDATWVAPAFFALGLSVGYIQAFMENSARKQAYECTVTYGTNSEFGFDFLRDNMKQSRAEQVQGALDFAIIDEVDSILIDEARTPLIISGPAHDEAPRYKAADEVARRLILCQGPWDKSNQVVELAKRKIKGTEGELKLARSDAARYGQLLKQLEEAKKELVEAEAQLPKDVQLYEVELDRKSVHLTHEGIQKAQEFAGVGSFYIGSNMDWPHLLEQSLRAHVVYERDRDYVVQEGEVVIVDEFTGRLMVGRQWSDGLHQAVEAKERVTVKPETQTMATITLQNFFKLYTRIAGMTGTAMTEAEEFHKIYRLDVVKIPTNRPIVRADQEDLIFMSERAKWNAVVEQIKEISDRGQPVLVGTTSVEKSERLSQMLTRRFGIEHEVLNAKNHEREADIVAKAGRQTTNRAGKVVGAVTIATNMAGRGTDIKLASGVTEVGGLFVLGTERHESRRIDNQLRGRSGRQGDPGTSRFFLSLEDDLMKLFAGDFTLRALQRLGMKEEEAIEHPWVSKAVERAQKKVEERNFGIRKNLLEYDEVRDVQRNYFYKLRQGILEGHNLQSMIFDIIGEAVDDAVKQYLDRDYVPNCIAEWARGNFNTVIEAQDLRDTNLDMLESAIKDRARDETRTNIRTSISEFMDPDADPQDWDYAGLANWAQSQFGAELLPSNLRKLDRDAIAESLTEAALVQIDRKDCSAVSRFMVPNYAQHQLADWAASKFDLEIKPEELLGRNIQQARDLILDRARQAYRRREAEYPLEYALEATMSSGGLENIYASEQLANWIQRKYGASLSGEEIRALSLEDLQHRMLEVCLQAPTLLKTQIQEAIAHFGVTPDLVRWVNQRFLTLLEDNDLCKLTPEACFGRIESEALAFLRRELTEMERAVLLQIFDTTWKDHLYAMDQLRDSIGLRGMAERDPRIEYKREGSALFTEFQKSIRDKVTDVIFRVKITENYSMRNVYARQQAIHQTANSYGVGGSAAASEVRSENNAAGDGPAITIVNQDQQVGRNDPCPCGSGKKFKQCCSKES